MKKLLLLLMCLTSCSLNMDVNPSFARPRAVVDYTGNLIDEWVANRGYNINNGVVIKWNGYKNNTLLTPGNAPLIPDNYIQPFDGNDYYTLTSTIGGALSAVFILNKPTTPTAATILFDSNTNTPRCQLFLRISSTNSHMGLSYNGVVKDCGASFPFDGNYHQLIYRIDGTHNTADIMVDNVKAGSSMTLTGGGLNCTQVLSLFRSSTGGSNLGIANLKKIRLYNESISDSIVNILYTGDFKDNIVDNTPTIFFVDSGQSNVQSPSADNLISLYPDSLKNGFTDVYLFNWISNANIFVSVPGNTQPFFTGSLPVSIGPNLAQFYEARKKFPGYTLRFVQVSKGSTSIYTDWNPTINTSLYIQKLKPACKNAFDLLKKVEQRNIVGSYFNWIQGEADADDSVKATGYQAALTSFAAAYRSEVDPSAKFIINELSINSNKTYKMQMRTSQQAFVAGDTLNNFLLNVDDAARFPLEISLHYKQLACINAGKDAIDKFVNP